MLPLIEQLQQGNFSAFSGAQMRLGLPLGQDLLNQALAQALSGKDGPLKEIRLEIRAHNKVDVSLAVHKWGLSKSFGFELEVERDLGFPDSPKIKLALPASHALLGSILEMLTSSLGLLPGGIEIAGRVIEVDLLQAVQGPQGGEASPQEQQKARAFLSLIKWGEIQSAPGALFLNMNLQVD